MEFRRWFGIAATLSNLGSITRTMGEYERSRELYLEALEIARKSGDRYAEAGILSNLGSLAESVGEVDWAGELFNESLEIRRELGDLKGIATTLTWLGELARKEEPDRAAELYEESLRIQLEIGDVIGSARSYSCMGEISLLRGELERAEDLFGKAYDISFDTGNNWGMATTLENRARVSLARGHYAEAEKLLRESHGILGRIGEAKSLVRVLGRLSEALVRQDRIDEARSVVTEGLAAALGVRLFEMSGDLLLSAAELLIGSGDSALAAECVASAEQTGIEGRAASRMAPLLELLEAGSGPPVEQAARSSVAGGEELIRRVISALSPGL